MNHVFVWTTKDVFLGIGLTVAAGFMLYAVVEYRVKEWRKDRERKLAEKLKR